MWSGPAQGFYSDGPQPAAGRVDVLSGSRVVASQRVGHDGRFSFVLPEGTYVLKGSPLPNGVCGRAPFHIAAAQVLSVEVDCRHGGGAVPS